MIVEVRGDDIEGAIRILRRIGMKNDMAFEAKKRQGFLTRSQIRKMKATRAQKRRTRNLRRNQDRKRTARG